MQETLSAFGLELRQIRDELRTVRGEFRALREEIAEIRALSGRVDSIEVRLDALEKIDITEGFTKDSKLNDIVVQVQRDINDRDQELLVNDVEIANLPEKSGENLTHLVQLVGIKLGVKLEERDIVSADRAGGRRINATDSAGPSETTPRRIVVRLARRDLREEILRSARIRRGVTTADLDLPGQPKRFYINERLTKINRQLFRQARETGKQNAWKYIWTSKGRIFARRGSGDVACRIRCENDVSRIFGNPNNGVQSP